MIDSCKHKVARKKMKQLQSGKGKPNFTVEVRDDSLDSVMACFWSAQLAENIHEVEIIGVKEFIDPKDEPDGGEPTWVVSYLFCGYPWIYITTPQTKTGEGYSVGFGHTIQIIKFLNESFVSFLTNTK